MLIDSGARARFFCGVCGKPAATVTLALAGQPDPRLTPEPNGAPLGISGLRSEFAGLSIQGGPMSCTTIVADVDIKLSKEALLDANAGALYAINYEFAPFWCPRCQCSYCQEHYPRMVTYDDGFFDAIYGICPQGHRRKIDD
jgi:hypothetical protein